MSPEAKRTKELLYVSNGDADEVDVYSYRSGKRVGALTGFVQPEGQCVNKRGNVWITNFGTKYQTGYAVEYAHGGSVPLKELQVYDPAIGCSVDPTSGNLAVNSPYGSGGALMFIFPKASGQPTKYHSYYCDWMYSPGYDNLGNLYVEGPDQFGLNVCVLPPSGGQFLLVTADVTLHSNGGMMWDGKYITLADTYYGESGWETVIYQMAGGLTNLSEVGETVLQCSGKADGYYTTLEQPFIVGARNTPVNNRQGTSVVFSQEQCGDRLDYWAYPSGGTRIKMIHSAESATGESVSIAP